MTEKKISCNNTKSSFAKNILPTLAFLILFPLLIYLGFWQFHRGQEKQRLLTQYSQAARQKPLSLQLLLTKPTAQQVGTHLTLTGKFDNAHYFLIDNITHAGQIGYYLITPFLLTQKTQKTQKTLSHTGTNSNFISQAIKGEGASEQAPQQMPSMILVNRGWIPLGGSREAYPKISPIIGQQTITGLIAFPNQKPFLLASEILPKNFSWPLRLQYIHLTLIRQALNQSFPDYILLIDPQLAISADPRFKPIRQWQLNTIPPSRHFGYALQWFSLAIALLIIFVVVNIRKIPIRKNRKPEL